MPGIGIVTNPNSRRNRRSPEFVRRLGYILGSDEDRHEMTRRPDDIRIVAERFKEHAVDILALNGGDGTNHVTLTTFIDVYGSTPLPKIAFLRGGTMNTISNAIGIKGTPGKILLNISEKYHLGIPFELSERDTLCVEYEDKRQYGFIFGNGVIANFLDAYYATGNPSPLIASKVLAAAILQAPFKGPLAAKMFEPFRARVSIDGQVLDAQEFSAVVASTIEQIGLGFRPFVRCRERPGSFNLLRIHTGPLGFALELPRIRLGQLPDPTKVPSHVCERALFESDAPIPFTIDGDMHVAQGKVELSCGPRLQIIVK
ncbi:MAG: diacylglycerol kinase family protein [Myxococcota bacterium]|jgi:diacylglycerol kinase family enzyme|nr:diacylglycerol kinase family protein [Myxococcota bacterium]